MEEDYDYTFIFAGGITITSTLRLKNFILDCNRIISRLQLQNFCLITIEKLFDYNNNLIALNSLSAC